MRKLITYADWTEFVQWAKEQDFSESFKSNIRVANKRFKDKGFTERTAVGIMNEAGYLEIDFKIN